jgi:hypothetical protein
MLMRFTGMAIGHMTHSNGPTPTVGVSSEALGEGKYSSNQLAFINST